MACFYCNGGWQLSVEGSYLGMNTISYCYHIQEMFWTVFKCTKDKDGVRSFTLLFGSHFGRQNFSKEYLYFLCLVCGKANVI